MLSSQRWAYFGEGRDLASITTVDVGEWIQWLYKQPNGRGGRLTQATARKALSCLSDLFKRAKSEGYSLQNPTSDLYHKPRPEQTTATYWEPWQVALLLEAARSLPADHVHRGRGNGGRILAGTYPWIYPLVATAALTGLRKAELLGLMVDDVDLHLNRIFVRPNAHRPLKTKRATRTAPIWPQLREILQEWMYGGETPRTSGLLFTAPGRGVVGDLRKSFDQMGELCGLEEAEVRTRRFRHTYCSARLATVQKILKPGHEPTDSDAWEYVEQL